MVAAHANVHAVLIDGVWVVKADRVNVVVGAIRPANEDDLLARGYGGLGKLSLVEDGGLVAAVDGPGRTVFGVVVLPDHVVEQLRELAGVPGFDDKDWKRKTGPAPSRNAEIGRGRADRAICSALP